MKIISWNVNGLRAVERKGNLRELIELENPEILMFQEIKAKPEQVEFLEEKYPEYKKFYHSAEKPGYSGTAIWINKKIVCHPEFISGSLTFTTGMPNDPVANEGRIARIDFELEAKKYAILGVYFPNGGKSPEAWKEKLIFYEKFLEYVNTIRTEGIECIWAGDVNCAHNPIDLARPENNEGVIGFHPKERAWLDKWIESGWIDTWRKTYPEKKDVYSWWHVITRSRTRNVGWRIDYFFVDKKLFPQVKNIDYLTQQMGSDHCPVVLEV